MGGLERDTQMLKELCKFAGLLPSPLANKAGVNPTTILRPYNGTATTRLSQPTIGKLRDAFPGFPGWSDYLGLDRAAEPRDEYRFDGAPVQAVRKGSRKPDIGNDTVELEQIDLKFGLGGTYTDSLVEVARRPFSRAWLRSITPTAPQHLFWAIGDGDSMEPTIRSGEVLLIDRSEFSPRFDDSIWALVHGEIGMIKRLRQLPGGTMELHSDNHLVRPQIAVDGELHVIGRVIAVVRRL